MYRARPRRGVARWTVLCAFAALCGCGQPLGSSGAARLPRIVPGPGLAAASYTTAVPSGSGIVDDDAHTIAQAVTRASEQRGMTLTADPRLMRLAAWALDHLAADGSPPPYAALDLAARHLGLVEPAPHLVMFWGNVQSVVAEQLAEKLRSAVLENEYSHYGGVALERHGIYSYVVALAFRFIELNAISRSVPTHSSVQLTGRLTHGFASPTLVITRPDGQVVRGATGRGKAFTESVPAAERGIYRVELVADGPMGPAPVANFPLYVGESPQTMITLDPDKAEVPVQTTGEAAQRMLELTNRERTRAGLAPVTFDARLATVAAAHVADMLQHRFVGHTSPTTGTPSERVQHAGIRTSFVLENIGRGASLGEVHAGLMESPGHRGNLLHPDATHVGIAVALSNEGGGNEYLVTELFIRVNPALSSDAKEQLLSQINAQRTRSSRRPLQNDPALSAIAERGAGRCFDAPIDDAQLMQRVRADLQRTPQHGVTGALLALGSTIADLAQLDAVLAPGLHRLGIGLTQGDRSDTVPNALCAVFVLAE